MKISAARVHDKIFLKSLDQFSHNNMVVFDKAYSFYHQFALWANQHLIFVMNKKPNNYVSKINWKSKSREIPQKL